MFVLLAIAVTGITQDIEAQRVAAKSNILADAFLNPNLGIEVGLAPKWTLDITGQFNAWTLSHDRRWKHWVFQPEARYWFRDRFSFRGTLLALTFMADSIISEVSTDKSTSSVRMPAN